MLFTREGEIKSVVQREFPQIFPREGWVEHDPLEISATQISVACEALLKIGGSWDEVYGIGITNQRETVIVWDKLTGAPIYNAIVWQCRRTAELCDELRALGLEPVIRDRTGLLLDPYFSATKIRWILDNVDGARELANADRLAFGTVDTWLIWKLTGGKVHATDYSNASRTMLFNIHTLTWDDTLLELFDIPKSMLPSVVSSSEIIGYTDAGVLGASVPMAGVAGDQQAALFGQCCFDKGEIKNTFGTGAFLLMNTGYEPKENESGLITTVAWGLDGRVTYALEGSVFTSGAAIQWLRDGLRIIESSADSEYYARKVEDSGNVMVVPAFTGLGAPYWDPYARGTIIGITRATTKYHIIRATLESLAYQTLDVVRLMESITDSKISALKVDGGASANNLLLEFCADILNAPLIRPQSIETTALGAAYLAGLALGVYKDTDEIRKINGIEKTFVPTKSDSWREERIERWHKAVERSLAFAQL